MTERAGTLQGLDPLGALAGRPLTVLAGVVAVAVAVLSWAVHASDIARVDVAAVALALAVAASAALVFATGPMRAPVGLPAAAVVVTIALAAEVTAAIATWGQNELLRDDWGPAVVGLMLLALSPYRPPAELRALTAVAAAVTGVVTLIETPFFVTDLPPTIFVAIAVVPVLALGLGGAAFAGTVIERLQRWRARAERASLSDARTREEGIVRSVQQGRVSILNRDVVPLLAGILDEGRITAEHVASASRVAESVRSLMVAESERTWLDELIANAGPSPVPVGGAVHDPSRSAERMDFEQRAAVRALVSALVARAFASELVVRVAEAGGVCGVELRCEVRLGGFEPVLAPFLAVLRAVFDDVALETEPPLLILRFTYAPS